MYLLKKKQYYVNFANINNNDIIISISHELKSSVNYFFTNGLMCSHTLMILQYYFGNFSLLL